VSPGTQSDSAPGEKNSRAPLVIGVTLLALAAGAALFFYLR
jgi:LPXTG-motif cell wall-anchored protein